MKPLNLIDALRNSDEYIKYIYSEGGCYQFYLFLKTIFSTAIPYMNKEKTHVVTRIGEFFYDINGIAEGEYFNMTAEDVKLAEKWNFKKYQLLKIGECEVCGEPFTYQMKG